MISLLTEMETSQLSPAHEGDIMNYCPACDILSTNENLLFHSEG